MKMKIPTFKTNKEAQDIVDSANLGKVGQHQCARSKAVARRREAMGLRARYPLYRVHPPTYGRCRIIQRRIDDHGEVHDP